MSIKHPFGVFCSLEVCEKFFRYLSKTTGLGETDTRDLLKNFSETLVANESLAAFGKKITRCLIIATRQSFECTERYEDEDILSWFCPFPVDNLRILTHHCIEKIRTLDLVSRKWNLNEAKLQQFGDLVWDLVIASVADTQIWHLARKIKDQEKLEADLVEIVNFIKSRYSDDSEESRIRKSVLVNFKKI
jgi:hypothetical protein